MNNILSFDVEDYHQIFYRNWLGRNVEPTREVVNRTDMVLDVLKEFGCTATFFVVGRIAEQYPQLVERISAAGHELGSHGYDHKYVKQFSPDAFREDLARSKKIIEAIADTSIFGFRAPEFSIDRTTPWAFNILAELGFKYDSSLFPCSGARYGDSQVSQSPFKIATKHGSIMEFPLSTISVGKRRIPVAGGGYIRFFPASFNSWAIRKINDDNRRAVVYLHPHEFEPHPEPIQYGHVDLRRRMKAMLFHRKQMVGRRNCLNKLRHLLGKHRFSSFDAEFSFKAAAEASVRDHQATGADPVFRRANEA